MSVRIRCVGLADPSQRCRQAGLYLAAYDPEGNDGCGKHEWTADPAKAMIFDSWVAAHAAWTLVPANRPVRPDGQVNRPLCAFTIVTEPAGD